MLKAHGDWMELGAADEQKLAKDGTVEAWGRSENNPVSRLVWLEKRLSWTFWLVCSAFDGGVGLG